MDAPTVIAIVVGIINLIVLGIVGWQTLLTRSAIKSAQHTKVIEDIGTASAVIWVNSLLTKWKEDLKQMIADEKLMREGARAGNTTLGEKYGKETPNGLIIKSMYETLPSWLQIITMSAAKYYFECKGAAFALSGDNPELILKFIPGVISRAKEGFLRIDEMLSYIEKMTPKWYLQTPININDDNFMDR